MEARIEEAVGLIMQATPPHDLELMLSTSQFWSGPARLVRWLIPAVRICISPQCGFASVAEGNPISEEVRGFDSSGWGVSDAA